MAVTTPQELSAAFGAAVNAGDLATALELWTEDAVIVQPDGQTVRGRDAIAAALRALVEHEVRIDIHVEHTVTAGDIAVASGSLTMSGTGADGRAFNQRSDSIVVYSRAADGLWRLAIDAPWGLPRR
ncbi:MAG TPA: SgcJ/EcaC family oxidoreductase [Solirubrobacteraceae bacterium]|nr:SgcJ/EcaC family oxidoreductase [Solirubrobacteraceae bacterium]